MQGCSRNVANLASLDKPRVAIILHMNKSKLAIATETKLARVCEEYGTVCAEMVGHDCWNILGQNMYNPPPPPPPNL